MALPTIFGVITDLIGITVGACSNQPQITPYQSEHLKALHYRNTTAHIYQSRIPREEREAMKKLYWDKFRRSDIARTNKQLSNIIQTELTFCNFDYAKEFFKKYFPDLD